MREPGRRPMWPVGAVIPLLAALSLVAACGGGGGDGGSEEPGTAAGASSGPPPRPPPPSCVQTVLGCLTQTEFETRRQAIEDAHGDEADFRNQWGLDAIRADRAWAQLELKRGIGTTPGRGQTVGLIDTGIDRAHPVFAGKTVTEVLFSGDGDAGGDESSHGTAVASVIVAQPRDAGFIDRVTAARGVAPGADVAMFAVAAGSSGGVYTPISLAALGSADARSAYRFNRVIDWSRGGRTLDFVNVSVGFLGIIDQYGEQELRARYGAAIAALAQAGAGEKTVFVFSAGNAHGDLCDPAHFTASPDLCERHLDPDNRTRYRVNAKSVDFEAGLPARIPELRGHLVAVVAVAPDDDSDGDHEIASFSNRCGIASRWCIAAPGQRIRSAYFGPHPDTSEPGIRGAYSPSGTSFSAPMVTGSLVVMKHHFRSEISNTGLVSRLFATAYDKGIYADRAVYGHGLLDLAAALSPQGTPRVALGNRVDGAGADLTHTRLELGGALGDGLTQALAGREIAAFDSLGAPFWYSLGGFTRAAPGPALEGRLRGLLAGPEAAGGSGVWRPVLGAAEGGGEDAGPGWLQLGLLDAPAQGAGGGGHLSLAGPALALRTAGPGGFGAALFSSEGREARAPVSGAALSWRSEGASLGLRGGVVGERETLLGSSAAGAFGRVAAGAVFAGVEASAPAGSWRLGAGAELGAVNPSARGGLISDVSRLATSAFAFHAAGPLTDAGKLTLSVSQPLRVEAGRARLSIPVGRTKDGRVRRQPVTASLAPSGRQIEVAAKWRRPLASGGELGLGAVWTREPGHVAAAEPHLGLFAGWRRAF